MAKPPDRQRPPVTTPNLIPPINVTDLTTYPLKKRYSKVRVSDSARPWRRGGSFSQFYRSLPDILGVKTLRAVAKAIAKAHRKGRPVIVGIGAHVVKVGLSPILVDLMQQGIVSAVAMNGAGIIHDFELALMGHTSEEVDAEIDEGRFGMAEETGRMLNEAIVRGAHDREGLGESVGHYINRRQGQFPHRETSILATGATARYSGDRACRHRHRHHPYASCRGRLCHWRDLAAGLSTACGRRVRDGRGRVSQSRLCRHFAGSLPQSRCRWGAILVMI